MTRARRTERPVSGDARGPAGDNGPPASRASASAVHDQAAHGKTPKRGSNAPPRRLLGRYRLEKQIGAGATSTVWLGQDEHLDRAVAVKILHPHLLPDDAARRRIEREARTAARLNHPNIVAVYDAVATDDAAAIVLEYVPGEGLDDRLHRSGPMAPAEASRMGAELASALLAAQAEGIVHRDVKPANVLLGEDGRARLADFGIAQALDDGAATLTETGSIVGTLRYMSPERLEGQAPTPAADIWGLGAVLLEAITGRPPYNARTPIELLEAARLRPPDLSGVPESLAPLLQGMLSSEPAARPTASGLQAPLAAAAGSIAPAALADLADGPADPPADAPTQVLAIPEATGAAAAARAGNRPTARPGAMAAAGVAVLAVAVLLMGAIWADNSASAPDPASSAPASRLASPTVKPTPAPTEKPPGKGRGKHGGGKGD